MKIWQKLTLAAATALIPLVILAAMLWNSGNGARSSGRRESAGLEYEAALRAPMEHVAHHLAVSAAIINGDQTLETENAALVPAIDADLTALDAVDRKRGEQFGTGEKLAGLVRGWRDLKAKGTELAAAENLQRHTALMSGLADLVRTVGDKSGLRSQPEAGAAQLASALLMDIPQMSGDLGQAASGITAVGDKNPPRVQLAAHVLLVRRGLDSLRRDLQPAGAADSDAAQTLSPALTAAVTAVESFLQLSTDEGTRAGTRQYCEAQRAALSAVTKLGDAVSAKLQPLMEERAAGLTTQSEEILALLIVALLAVFGSVWWVYGGMRRQLRSLTGLFDEIGAGNFAARAEVTGGGELADIAISVNDLLGGALNLTLQSSGERDRLQASIRKLLDEISDAAQGDLTVEAEVTSEATGAIADSFNYLVHELRTLIGNVQVTTMAVRSSAADVETANLQLASGSQSQASRIMEASAAIDDMLVSIADVSKNAGSAAEVAEKALKNARSGADSVQRTINGMDGIRQQVQQTAKRIKRLGEGSQEIGEIVELIGDIADRTSILALNASIQAAMAGDAGKGFAVVAEEVERLADRSTKATKKIAGLIRSIQSDTNEAMAAMEETTREVVDGSALANEAGQKLSEIESVSNLLAELIQSILMASRQQSRGSDAVARSMSDISRVTQEAASGTQRAVAAIRRLSELAEELRGSLHGFKLPPQAAA